MGCCPCFGKKRKEETPPEDQPKPQYSWDQKERVDRSLLIISDQTGGTVGRLPGQLNGRQFRIKNCQSTTILVLDYTDTVSVEKCTDCQIFIGPTKGSLYLRECTNSQFVVACQQFRARDCKKCTISLFTPTQPVIESSTKLKFACFQGNYPQLNDQFQAIGQSVFNNCWSNVHDFDQGDRGPDVSNWSLLLPPDTPPVLSLPSEGEFSQVGVSLGSEGSLVPLTVGPSGKPEGETCLVVFFEDSEDRALEFTHQLHPKAVLSLTKKMALNDLEVQKLFPHDESLQNRASKGNMILLEVCGEDCVSLCQSLLQEVLSSETVYVSPTPEQGLLDSQAFNTVNEISLTM